VGLHVLRLTDPSRLIRLPSGARERRPLITYVRYPALGSPSGHDVPNAPPARSAGPFPLVVFGHGYAVTPNIYSRLLQAWARAGYVVAAPVFPLENANAPGGPDESDLVNQPRDMSVVMSRLITAPGDLRVVRRPHPTAGNRRSGPLSQMIDAHRIGVAGHSDGGETALAVAYDRRFRDPRVRAAAILSGAEIPTVGGFSFPPASPPLLATQGSADTVNRPSFTRAFFLAATRPKFLLTLPGAGHLPPFTGGQPQLGIVERVTVAFFDAYLRGQVGAYPRLLAQGSVAGLSTLRALP